MTRPLATAAFAAVYLLFAAACQTGDSATPTSIPALEATATSTPAPPPIDILPTLTPTPTPRPTATPLPPATPVGLWVFDVARARHSVLYEGAEAAVAHVEAPGDAISIAVAAVDGPAARRFSPGGELLEEFSDRGAVTTAENSEARYYLDLTDAEVPQLVLEHQGTVVRLEGTRSRIGIAFSPAGDRLLTLSERPGILEGEVTRTFSVHNTTDGRLHMQFEHRAIAGSPALGHWSPSGRYIADQGLDGVFVRDTLTGQATRLGPNGSSRWSPVAEQLVVITDQGRASTVNVPRLDGTDFGPVGAGASVGFDQSGTLALIATDDTARAFAVSDGVEVSSWSGLAANPRVDPPVVVQLEAGLAALSTADSCVGGFVVQHHNLGTDGRCIEGAQPRWSPSARLLVFLRDRDVVLLSLSSDVERVIAQGAPSADGPSAPTLEWSPDGSWILIQWAGEVVTN